MFGVSKVAFKDGGKYLKCWNFKGINIQYMGMQQGVRVGIQCYQDVVKITHRRCGLLFPSLTPGGRRPSTVVTLVSSESLEVITGQLWSLRVV